MRLLVLTDHRGHSSQNSLYTLTRALVAHPEVTEVAVASRGHSANDGFFYRYDRTELWAHIADSDFEYQADAAALLHHVVPVQLADFDGIVLRLPRPIPDGFFDHLRAEYDESRISNRPSGIERTGTKAFLLHFPELCPPMQLVHSLEEIDRVRKLYPVVLKPLEEYGGRGLVRIDGNRVWEGTTEMRLDAFYQKYRDTEIEYLATRYLKNVSQGDKRIIMAGDRVLAATLRLPAEGSWLCNIAQGGRAVITPPTDFELHIAATIAPVLAEHGIVLYGFDTLMDDDGRRILSEINTLSIGGIAPYVAETGDRIDRVAAEALIRALQ